MTGVAAALASLVLAHVALGAVLNVMPLEYGALGTARVTPRVVAFALLMTGAIVVACVVPAWLSARSATVSNVVRRQASESSVTRRSRFLLVAGQTAVAIVLMVGATFLTRSYANLWLQPTGYSGDTRLISVSYPESRTSPQLMDTLSATIDALRRVPGVSAAAAGIHTGELLDGYGGAGGPTIRAGNRAAMLVPSQVTTGYFDVIGTHVHAGRPLAASDRGWDAVVVNEAFARHFWPDTPPEQIVGQAMTANGRPGHVVGVARDTHGRALDIRPRPMIYKPFDVWTGPRRLSFAILPAADRPISEAALRRAVTSVDADAIVDAIDSVHGRLAESVRDRTFATLALGVFAAAGVGVCATGVFSIAAFVAARRTREIAIRLALGADAHHVRRLVVGGVLMAATSGGVVGLVASQALVRSLEGHLYGVAAGDWATHAAAVVALAAITALAAWWPTRRAVRVQPIVALRAD